MTDLFIVWTPAAILSVILGGAGLGVMATIFERTDLLPIRQVVTSILVLGLPPTVVFWAGQFYDTVTGPNGAALGARVLSRALLMVLFVLIIAASAAIGLWNKRRTRS